MASVESSTLSKRFLVVSENLAGSDGSAELFVYSDYDNAADAISAMNDAQEAQTSINFYVVEALTSLPNPADS